MASSVLVISDDEDWEVVSTPRISKNKDTYVSVSEIEFQCDTEDEKDAFDEDDDEVEVIQSLPTNQKTSPSTLEEGDELVDLTDSTFEERYQQYLKTRDQSPDNDIIDSYSTVQNVNYTYSNNNNNNNNSQYNELNDDEIIVNIASTKTQNLSSTTMKKRKATKEAWKEITILVDNNIVQSAGGGDLLSAFHNLSNTSQSSFNILVTPNDISNSIQWRRSIIPPSRSRSKQRKKTTKKSKSARYNDDDDNEEQIGDNEEGRGGDNMNDKFQYTERFVVVKMGAAEFVELVKKDTFKTYCYKLQEKINRLKYDQLNVCLQSPHFISLPDDMKAYLKDKDFQVTFLMIGVEKEIKSLTTSSSKSKMNHHELVGRIEEELMWLELESGFFLRHVNNIPSAAKFIHIFTEAIAESLYKEKSAFESFCAESMTKRGSSSAEPKQIWINQLMQIQNVSESIAQAIAEYFPSVMSLYDLYDDPKVREIDKIDALKLIEIPGRKGKSTTVGSALSKKIYTIFNESEGSKLVH